MVLILINGQENLGIKVCFYFHSRLAKQNILLIIGLQTNLLLSKYFSCICFVKNLYVQNVVKTSRLFLTNDLTYLKTDTDPWSYFSSF